MPMQAHLSSAETEDMSSDNLRLHLAWFLLVCVSVLLNAFLKSVITVNE